MSPNAFLHKFAVLIGAVMIIAGIGLGVLAYNQIHTLPGVEKSVLAAVLDSTPSLSPVPNTSPPTQSASPLAQPTEATPPAAVAQAAPEAPQGDALTVALGDNLPPELISAMSTQVLDGSNRLLNITIVPRDHDARMVQMDWEAEAGEAIYQQVFAAATRFDTIDLNLRTLHIERAWRGNTSRFTAIAVLSDTLPALTQLLGPAGDTVTGYADMETLIGATWATRDMLAIVPFDLLQPDLAVYNVDGQTPVENSVKFNAAAYPLAATVYAHLHPDAPSDTLSRLALALPTTNRDSSRLTVVAMTGVTAMVRLTAAEMDNRGPAWPAEVVGAELAAADITHISNEVPFVPD